MTHRLQEKQIKMIDLLARGIRQPSSQLNNRRRGGPMGVDPPSNKEVGVQIPSEILGNFLALVPLPSVSLPLPTADLVNGSSGSGSGQVVFGSGYV